MNTVTLAGRREWIALAVLALPTLLLSIDVSVLYLALPPLSQSLHANSGQQLWIMDIYNFMIAGWLVTMGTAADRLGYRPIMLIGALGFSLASIMAAFSTTAGMLIAARALMGITGATLMPCTLGLIRHMFHDAHQRATAISLWMSCFMVGMVIGPLVGGVIIEHFHWGGVFLMGVPVMLLLLVAGPLLLPGYREGTTHTLDPVGVILSLLAILPFVYGCTELARSGWSFWPLLILLAGIVFGVVFVRRERRQADPLLDLRLFADRVFSATLIVLFFIAIAMGGISIFTAQYLQMVLGLSPLHAGLWMVPQAVFMMIGFLISPPLAKRFRPGGLFAVGLVIAAIGLFLIALVGPDAISPGPGSVPAGRGLALVVIGGVLSAFGIAPAVSLGTGIVISAAPPEKAGSASAICETCNELGVALGVALLGSLGAFFYRLRLPSFLPSGLSVRDLFAAREGFASAFTLVPAVRPQAAAAYMSGMQVAAGVSAVVLAGLAVISVVGLRSVRPLGAGAAH
ncbi:MFS transporter [Dinghuibacter silviterrae]|uniref:DHA2 family multidrug resistance protein-like MFS transporter n=1 Tax=Dinghuibacter silviterrae TaxID=1539049 RepID=A0A4R8DGN5_9BACT|nr:MFS transporter [Dinghuibacter silviterrae]TDW96831.1 DHA2 family multidrug resistance protein-like MFS transporter [Dinghuibacter silviterrae]